MIYEKKIAEQYGEEYIIRQLAEEAAELCQAALKLVRAMRRSTPSRTCWKRWPMWRSC